MLQLQLVQLMQRFAHLKLEPIESPLDALVSMLRCCFE